jgi:hypothetical protein
MKYYGLAKKELGSMRMPDAFDRVEDGQMFEVIEIGNDILLVPSPFDRGRLALIEKLARTSIDDHRRTLEALTR